jgi:carbon monoxide dehydrogenase subunit G
MSDPEVERGVRRIVGIAALRRLRRMVDADAAAEVEKSALATRLAWAFAVAAVLAVAWIAFR